MSIFRHFNDIEKIEEKKKIKLEEFMQDIGGVDGIGFSNVPWQQNTPWAIESDWDFDGIPDALDNKVGWGAF